MTTWEQLRPVLADLERDPHHPLQGYPNPRAGEVHPPYRIRLDAWAEGIAADLHSRFGADVDLTVGFLGYPDRRLIRTGDPTTQGAPPPPLPLLPPDQATVSLDEPLDVPSGHTVRGHLRVTNHRSGEMVASTNGALTARLLDPHSAEPVGGFAGPETMPLVRFPVPPGGSATIPLLLGTASLVPELGYAVPPGVWAFDTRLRLEEGTFRTPPLPVRVVP